MIIEDLQIQGREDPFPGQWRMSGFGGCPREQLAFAQGRLLTRGTNQGAAREGSLHELDLIKRLQAAGYEVVDCLDDQPELQLRWGGDDWPLIGHPDGKIKVANDWMRLEIKSKGLARFKKLQKLGVQIAYPVEYAQVHAYMAAEGLAQCIYICKNRDTGKLYEEIIPFDAGWFDAFLDQHFAPVVMGYTNGDDPMSLPCHSDESVRQWCGYRYACEDTTEVAEDLPDVTEITDDLERWSEISEVASDLDAEIAAIKKKVKGFMIKNGTKKAVIAGVSMSLSSFPRTSLDREVLAEMVPEEVLAQAMKTVDVEQLRLSK
jgi:hypothetical protein